MFRELTNFRGVNWWTMLGAIGLNFIISLMVSLLGAYLGTNESTKELYARWGIVVMMALIFFLCVLAGWATAKIADDVPLKHAFWGSIGAAMPFLASAVMFINPMQLMVAGVAIAGGLNGGMLGTPKPHTPRQSGEPRLRR